MEINDSAHENKIISNNIITPHNGSGIAKGGPSRAWALLNLGQALPTELLALYIVQAG